ncbi:RNA polymerase-associated protein RapA [Candidatus Lokiarchaeum ossiferum]|uniref:RNA polymerase-associated protein RapA n=1 Tax=Candidatus Lokiarchaeum ossiferum TaxID=2951803 RepID=A0ABY6HLL0_9ARCH|nr:RNA polymerase-associated protein RapA [Candidatus Lokiarchaeum sp. B-35]
MTARQRLWRIDQIHFDENQEFYYYSVSNVSGVPSNEVLFPSIESIKKSEIPPPAKDKLGSPRYQQLLLQALRLDLIYGTTSFISLQNSKVIPISYQMVPVLMALNMKKVRLLLADDVGLGKTVETGLILQELLGRKRINRVLFVTPANLREQWQTILRNFFGIDAVIMSRRNRRHLESELLVGGSPWGYYNFVITSVDYAKQLDVRSEIMQFNWDMVVMDEAHNIMMPHGGVDDVDNKNIKKSYLFARQLTEKYPHLLLLTATPHNGYKDSYTSLLKMVNPNIIEEVDTEIEIDKDLAINHVCQRRRHDVEQWIGDRYEKSPFPERDSDEIFITPSDQFHHTMEKLSKFANYVMNYVNKLTTEDNQRSYWTILHFFKRAISSPEALICSIDNRNDEIDKKLNEKHQAIENLTQFLSIEEAGQSVLDGAETDRISEEERDIRNDRIVLAQSMDLLSQEKGLLLEVQVEAEKLKKKDRKVDELINEIIPNLLKNSKKVILFTRYIDTLKYIHQNLKETIDSGSLRYKGMDLFYVHGQLPSQKRMEIYDDFLKNPAAILISTDCMAEGIDLQFSANQIINYELTWNPNRLEQRNGRVDRFGQPEPKVFIRTLIMKDTIEMDILELLVKKAQNIKEEYGFVPGFFGDPKDIIDRLTKRRKEKLKPQATLDSYLKLTPRIMDDLVSTFYNKENLEEILKDSFYGHNNIDLQEIEHRMQMSQEKIGSSATIFAFLKSSVQLYKGNLTQAKENEHIFEVQLPPEILHDLNVEVEGPIRVTQNMNLGATRKDVDALSLKNALIAGLIEKVKNEAFIEEKQFYGRTAAFTSTHAETVKAIYHLKIRYYINTDPPSITEEITTLGIDLFSEDILTEKSINQIISGEMNNAGKPDAFVLKHIAKALENTDLEIKFEDLANRRKQELINERTDLIQRLQEQGLTADLQGISDVKVVGTDLLTIAIIYPQGD